MDITSTDGKTGIDPFESCLTIASACNLVFRTKLLQDESIGIIPSHGYRPEQKQPMKAQYWMKYISECEDIHIQHVGNGGEKKVGSYLVDGYYTTKAGEQIVMEFNGCFWYGCHKCYAVLTVNPVTDCLMSDLYQRTLDKKRYLDDNGYKYVGKWECEFDQQCKEDEMLQQYVKEMGTVLLPLEPRDAFYGGRTEAFTLYKEATDDEKIK